MPNHCDTDMWIEGPTELLAIIRDKHIASDGALNCDSLIPYPDNFRQLDATANAWEDNQRAAGKYPQQTAGRPTDGFNSGGYEWRIEHWGTKWGTYDGESVRERKSHNRGWGKLRLRFHSAWSPPVPVIAALAKKYPRCRIVIHAYEAGAGYKIHAVWLNGSLDDYTEDSYRGRRGG